MDVKFYIKFRNAWVKVKRLLHIYYYIIIFNLWYLTINHFVIDHFVELLNIYTKLTFYFKINLMFPNDLWCSSYSQKTRNNHFKYCSVLITLCYTNLRPPIYSFYELYTPIRHQFNKYCDAGQLYQFATSWICGWFDSMLAGDWIDWMSSTTANAVLLIDFGTLKGLWWQNTHFGLDNR